MEAVKVFAITEGSSKVGFGHITRMLSIYQAFEEKSIRPKFIINGDSSVEDLVKETDYEIYDWLKHREKLLNQIKNADIVIIDSYLADLHIYQEISKIVKVPVYYDDNKRVDYPCGIVVNGNIHALDLDYPKKQCIKYLLGTKYVPLRREFWNVPEKKVSERIESVMITFGGDDIRNLTPKTLRLLNEIYPKLKKDVIIGRGFKNIEEIEKVADGNANLIYFPDAEKMKEVMLESDIAISAGGQTLYELCRCGTPCISVAVAKNQLNNVKEFHRLGIIKYAGWWEDWSSIFINLKNYLKELENYDTRKFILSKTQRVIDGFGQKVFIEYIINFLRSCW